ncbi:8614_t:CDS:2, partial [Paraglomus occultum]
LSVPILKISHVNRTYNLVILLAVEIDPSLEDALLVSDRYGRLGAEIDLKIEVFSESDNPEPIHKFKLWWRIC